MNHKIKKNVVITGGATGLGAALCECFLDDDWGVIAIDSNEVGLNEFKARLSETQAHRLHTYVADVSDYNALEAVALEIVALQIGPVSIWINNAGIAKVGSFDEVSIDDFESSVRVNLLGVYYGSKISYSLMKSQGYGQIVNVSSISGIVPAPFMTSYAATKYGVVGLTRSLREECVQTENGIDIQLVLPGFVKTDMLKGQSLELPDWLSSTLENPKTVMYEVYKKILKRDAEIVVTRNGKVMAGINRIFPRVLPKASRFVTGKNWKQRLGLEPIESD